MPTYTITEVCTYTITADTRADAEEIAVNYPEADPSYRLAALEREIIEEDR
jgi:hypothetical protein